MIIAAAPLALAEILFPWVDPVALDLPGPVDVRWYGLMYLVGFAAGYVVLRRLVRAGDLALAPSAVGDLVGSLVLGVIVGGRLGYLLFYDLRDVAARPLEALRVWEGGMSFHGGLLGVAVALVWFARRRRAPVLNLADAIALAAPFGIAAVRVANFINGELYGRLASAGVPWAVRFPTDPVALRLLGAEGLSLRERERRIQGAYESGLWEAVRDQVPLRHPSQLYEALGEGVLLGAALWSLYAWRRRQGRRAPSGTYAGLFLVGYGIARFVVEFFRQPDAQFRGPGDPVGTVLGPLTMGQTLSTLMLLAGVGILLRAWRRGRRAGGEQPTADGVGREP
jgi:phosphatidylglycerol:prolipoprotein diacylglycerol transferase